MIDPFLSPTTPNVEIFNNLLKSPSSPPPQYTSRSTPLAQNQASNPHFNLSLSSSPLPSPVYSPLLSHHLDYHHAPPSPYTRPFSPYLYSTSHPQSPSLSSEHTSFLPFTLPLYSHLCNYPTTLPGSSLTSSKLKKRRERSRRTRLIGIIACVTLLLIAFAVGLAVVGVVFGWGKGGYCVRWDDGESSGDCKGEGSP